MCPSENIDMGCQSLFIISVKNLWCYQWANPDERAAFMSRTSPEKNVTA